MVAYIIPGKFFDSRESRSPKSKIFTGHQTISWFHFFLFTKQTPHLSFSFSYTPRILFSSTIFYEQKLHYSNRFIITISLQTSLQKARGVSQRKLSNVAKACWAQRCATKFDDFHVCVTLKDVKAVAISSMSSRIVVASERCLALSCHSETSS